MADAVAFLSYPRHARFERDLANWLSKEVFYKLSQNVVDVPLCYKSASNDAQSDTAIKRNDTPDHNTWLMVGVMCNNESGIGTLFWASPDTSSMIFKTQLEVGCIAKHYTSPVSMIPT
ncbi:hypothetical protein TNCV_2437921 [Trichonephila clavipes]|nr:hypothetical protein TNCV_2437921 [Trichonephila clavipes]